MRNDAIQLELNLVTNVAAIIEKNWTQKIDLGGFGGMMVQFSAPVMNCFRRVSIPPKADPFLPPSEMANRVTGRLDQELSHDRRRCRYRARPSTSR